MTLDQLRIFLAVAELEHVTLAAQRLNLTQSAVSGALRALEVRHGVQLFDRVGRGIRLNATGLALREKAEAVLAAANDAEALLGDTNQLRLGSLTIHASQTITSNWLPRHLVAFHALHPRIRIEARVGNTGQCLAAIRDGHCDLAFVEGAVEAPFLEEEMVARDHLAIIAAPSETAALSGMRFPEDLSSRSWILREQGSGTRSTFEAAVTGAGFDLRRLEIALELWTSEAICFAVEHSNHFGVVPRIVSEPLVRAGRLVEHTHHGMERSFRMLRHRERHPAAAAVRFMAMIREAAGACAAPSGHANENRSKASRKPA